MGHLADKQITADASADFGVGAPENSVSAVMTKGFPKEYARNDTFGSVPTRSLSVHWTLKGNETQGLLQ